MFVTVTPIGYSCADTAAYLESTSGWFRLCGDVDEANRWVPGQRGGGESREVGGDRSRLCAIRCAHRGAGVQFARKGGVYEKKMLECEYFIELAYDDCSVEMRKKTLLLCSCQYFTCTFGPSGPRP